MCDCAVRVLPDRVLFAKNSDRDPNEAQHLEWFPARESAPGSLVDCTWIAVPQVSRTHAYLISRPFWMWGAEIGANEHGLVIGNEAVFTRRPVAEKGLTGMDLVRLALERAASADEAVEVITSLLADPGQGGGCGHEDRSFRYHNSFLIADRGGARVLETAGTEWAVENVQQGRSISNGLTIEPFASQYDDRWRTRGAQAAVRRARTEASAQRAETTADLISMLRDHGDDRKGPHYSRMNGAMSAPCVHAGGQVANSQTTASWVSELSATGVRHWVTGTAAPCTGLFKPVEVAIPLDLGPRPTDRFDPRTLWWRHERLHRAVMADPEFHLPTFQAERDALEKDWLAAPPGPAEAFAEADRRLAAWTERVLAEPSSDRRPRFARRYWGRRNERAGIPSLPS